jgi:thiamine-monophosphate kinase
MPCGSRLDLDQIALHAEGSDDQSLRNWLGWGDWNVIAAAASEDIAAIEQICARHGSAAIPLGSFDDGNSEVLLTRGGNTIPAARLESERFARDSWFSEGIDGYVTRLCAVPLP